jgi:serine/threonine protein kinase
MNKENKLNNIKNRLLILAPTVKEGLERECNKDDFEALDDKALGKGGFGHVWKVRHKESGKIYAIKVINKDYIRKENMVEQINREIEIMYKVDHPHIIKLYNHYEDDDNFYLIMHCAGKGQLYSQLKRIKRLDERTVAQFLREVISAVKYLHSLKPPIIHRDIKPENILLDNDGRVKLADFGWSNFYEEDKKRETYCGTPEYLAPEMVTKSGHNESVDIWSLGVLAFELLAGRPPFVYKGDTGSLYHDIKTLKIKWTDDFPTLAKNLISRILKLKPVERISLDDILTHPWFESIPQIRQVLPPYDYDAAAKLRTHLINVKQEDEEKVKDDIKSVLVKKRSTLKAEMATNKVEVPQIIKEEVENKEVTSELKGLKEELNKRDVKIKELQEKLDKKGSDESTLKMRAQEKQGLISEIENKTKLLLESESSLNVLKNEHNQLEKQYKTVQLLNEELTERSNNLEKLNQELTIKLNLFEAERQQEIITYEKKLRIAELNFVEKEDSQVDSDKIFLMTKEYLSELVELFKTKLTRLEEKLLNQEKNECEFRSNLIEKIDKRVNEMVNQLKENHEKTVMEEKVFFKKQLEEVNSKNINYTKSIEWYKQQIAELYPFKTKASVENYQLTKLNSEKEALFQIKQVLEEKNNNLENYLKNVNEKVFQLSDFKEKYKNAFLEAEKLFTKYVKNKNVRELINFKDVND